jgi:hypothetical protein
LTLSVVDTLVMTRTATAMMRSAVISRAGAQQISS